MAIHLDDKLRNVSIVGAAGKMGRGISLLLAQEMALLKWKNPDKSYVLNLIDPSEAGLEGLWAYIRSQVSGYAEKNITLLRNLAKDRSHLVENTDIITEFVTVVLSLMRLSSVVESASKSSLVFEAALEKEEFKVELFKKLKNLCSEETFFFTNTSSLPIGILDSGASLQGRLIGYHFYNPPAIQKLIEIIPSDSTKQELQDIALELAKRLKKTVVSSRDVAGFIGNGHFIRDGIYAFSEVSKLQSEYGFPGAVYIINKITQDFLVRPMGIFQLIDYVGIDVFYCIQKVMSKFLHQDLYHPIVETMIKLNVLGGQNSDSSQKNGFLLYEKNKPSGIFDPATSQYKRFSDGNWTQELDTKMGNMPAGWASWKALSSDPGKEPKLAQYFQNLSQANSPGSVLARAYMASSKAIAEKLVNDGVANCAEDVNCVLITGFYHLYGAVHNYYR